MISNSTATYTGPQTPAPLLAASERAQKASWWSYIAACCAGRRTQSRESVSPRIVVRPGMLLHATDRSYEVQRNGSWVCHPVQETRPAHESQIRLLPKPSHNKYTPK